MDYMSLMPTLKITTLSARSIDLAWLHPPKVKKELLQNLHYQISKAEVDNLTYEVVYEGKERMCPITELKPLTKYTFKLRMGRMEETGQVVWSREYTELETTTSDESVLSKASGKLLKAVSEGDHDAAVDIIKEHKGKLSMEARDKYGKTLLMIACQVGVPETIHLLLENGADPVATTRSGKTALTFAVTFGHLKAAEMLLKKNPELINYTDMGGSTALMWACENASVNKTGSSMTELLLRYGADISTRDVSGQTAFDRLCATSGNVRTAQVLIKSGAEILSVPSSKHPMTHLMTCAMNGHKELCRELMEKQLLDPRVKNDKGYTAQNYADASGHLVVSKLLEERAKFLNEEQNTTTAINK